MDIYKKKLSISLKQIKIGEKRCNSLQKGHPKSKLLFFPHRSLGDMYILALFKLSNAAIFSESYQLVVVGEVCRKAAESFGINNTISISQGDMECIIKYITVTGEDKTSCKILHYLYYHTSVFYELINHYKYTFVESYEKFVFHTKLQPAQSIPYSQISQELIDKFDFDKGKTVVLSPYAKSIPVLPYEWWVWFAMVLRNYGYKNIYTNCSKAESPLPQTKKLDVSIDEICGVLDYAGIFVGLRSGLCDIISRCKCKKIILYPKQPYLIKDMLGYYTFDQIPYANNYKEYELSECTFPFDEILDFLKS